MVTRSRHGFTIVELLIVIVIIGILAAITIVAYNGVTSKAKTSILIHGISDAGKQLLIDNATDGKYPSSLSQANGGRGITFPGTTSVQYVYTAATNSFCLSGTVDATSYKITNLDTSPIVGTCPAATNTFASIAWTQKTALGSKNWTAISSSDDASKLVMAESGGYIYTSTDSGASWTTRTGSGQRNWQSTSSSSDGSKILASTNGGYLFRSVDYGITWIQLTNGGSRNWMDADTSTDGTKLIGVTDTYIYTSTDSGNTWTQRASAGSAAWGGVTMSDDGTKIAATNMDSNKVYTSTDSGASWTVRGDGFLPSGGYIDSSADGSTIMTVGGGDGYMYVSTNSGVTWSQHQATAVEYGSSYFMGISVSSDGTKAVAVGGDTEPGYIMTTKDSGATWKQEVPGGYLNWTSVTTSRDGSKIFATSKIDQFAETPGYVVVGLYN